MQIVPLQAIPSQVVNVTLGGQVCRIKVYQKSTGLFLDLHLVDELICGGAICQSENLIVRAPYTGFVGDLAFVSTVDGLDHDYLSIGDGFFLAWFDAAEIAALEAAQQAAEIAG